MLTAIDSYNATGAGGQVFSWIDDDAARVAAVGRGDLHVLPSLPPVSQPQWACERIRVGERERALGAVDDEIADVLASRLEAREQVRRPDR